MTDDAVGQPAREQEIAAESKTAPPPRPGALLTQHRQQRGLSVEDVAKQLNLAPRQIQAIEAENYDALPGMASVRGFIRSYAKLLKIDAAPLLEQVAKETVVLQEPTTLPHGGPAAFGGARLPRMGRAGLPLKPLIGIGVLVVLLGAGFALHRQGMLPSLPAAIDGKLQELGSASARAPEDHAAKPAESAEAAASAGSVKAETVAPPLTASAEPNAASAASAASAPTPPAASAAAPAAVPAPAPAAPVAAANAAPAAMAAPEPATPAPAANAAPAAGNLLVLKVRKDSWVEVMRANHKPLVSRILKAGTTETVEINDPASLTIGNADGVDVIWRGKPLDLKSTAKNNVIRTNLK